jgi:hypothetical protein
MPSGQDRAFHTTRAVYTASFAPPVTVVGNQGRLSLHSDHISKRPQFHSPDLENRAPGQAPRLQLLRQDFHFSAHNYGYYCHLYVFLSSFRSRLSPHCIPIRSSAPLSHPTAFPAAQTLALPASTATVSRQAPLFSTSSSGSRNEYNQEVEKTVTSASPPCVVECGQRRMCINRVF